MRLTVLSAVAAVAVAFSGCAMSSASRHAANREFMNTSKVTGIIALPEGAPTDICDRITVAATYATPEAGAPATVGHSFVRQSRNRCSYEVDELPSDAALKLDVKSASEWKCANGAQASFTSDAAGNITLKNDETRTQDFKAVCSQQS